MKPNATSTCMMDVTKYQFTPLEAAQLMIVTRNIIK